MNDALLTHLYLELEWRAKTLFSMTCVINKCKIAWIGLFQSREKFLALF